MIVRVAVVLSCLAAWLGLFGPAAAAPLEAYGRLPNIEAATISPDGKKLGLILTDGERRQIRVYPPEDPADAQTLLVGDAKIRDLRWADPQTLLITSTKTASIVGLMGPRREYALVFAFDLAKKRGRNLMDGAGGSLNVAYGEPIVREVDGAPVVFLQGVHFVDHEGRLSLFRTPVDGREAELVETGSRDTRDWLVNAEGRPIAQVLHNDRNGGWSLRVRGEAGWRTVAEGADEDATPSLLGLGRDGRSALVHQRIEDQVALREIPPGGAWREPFLTREDGGAPLFDPQDGRLIGFHGLAGDEDIYEFFDPRDVQMWRAIQAAYPGQRVTLVSSSADRQRIVVRVDSPLEGPAYALVDLGARRAEWIGNEYQELRPEDIAPVRPVQFRAADGMALSGYLTLPRGRDAKGLPLVVLPHGGPAVRDVPGFDWWPQALASRGYAVLQVNYRGSAGFGRAHLEAGWGEWGRKMQTDLSDGVRHLAAEGVIDPARVCIVGASYGGYAALAGATVDRGVYRCAASFAGPSDLGKMVAWSRGTYGRSAQRYWSRFMGVDGARDSRLDEISPAKLADRVEIPVLLLHGRDDTVVPLSQSQAMERAMKRAGKPVELVVLGGEDHWLSRGETRMQMLGHMVAFLERHNPPQ